MYMHVCLIPYTQKFSPEENLRQFRPRLSLAKIFSTNFFVQWKFFTLRSTNSDQLFFLASTSSSMSLLSFFQVAPRRGLPSRSCRTAIIAISGPNTAVNRITQRAKQSKKRGAYIKLDEKIKIRISKYSSENGISAAARRFSLELAREGR